MSAPYDFTRWNRAGLSSLSYVDGNAVVFLEQLRDELAAHFPEWDWGRIRPGGTADEHLTTQYDEPRGDWAWEIARTFARACHVLGKHLDAYVNEGYLRTATQWDSVRRLVAMLDVHPAPPASASTPLAIEAAGEPATLPVGFALRYAPKDGGAPVVFETLDAVALDPALNAVHIAGWNRSPAPLVDLPPRRRLPGVASRSARIIEGVGPIYQWLLDASGPLGRGTFTVADFRTFEPAQAGGRAVRLWETRSKAGILLDFPWTAAELRPLAHRRLPEVLAQSPAQLAEITGRAPTDMARLLEDLRTAEMALDEPVFGALRLEELLSPGAPAAVPPPLWVAPDDSGISAGQVALVVSTAGSSEQAAVVRVSRVEPDSGAISLESVPFQPAWERWTRGVSSLLVRPKVVAAAQIAGSAGTLSFAAPHGLSARDRVAWQAEGTWHFATVARAGDVGVLLQGDEGPEVETEVYHAIEVEGASLPLGYVAAAALEGGGLHLLTSDDSRPEYFEDQKISRYIVTRPGTKRLVFVPGGARPVGRVLGVTAAAGEVTFRFGGKPGKLQSGHWVVGDDDGRLIALRIERIEESADHFTVVFERKAAPAPAVAALPANALKGVGAATERQLAPNRVMPIGEVAGTAPSPTHVRRLEARAKARLVTGFPFAESDLKPVLDQTLRQVSAKPADALAAELGKPPAWAAELIEALRLVQAMLDEPRLTSLRVRDLLPEGATRPAADDGPTHLDRLYGVFEHVIRPSGWDRNETPVSGKRLLLAAPPPGLLARGRRVVLERDGFAREATVTAVDHAARTIALTPALATEDGFTLGNLVLRANVVRAGHGETRPEKVLGSGDASLRSQRFVLAERDVAFVADPTQPVGVAAAVKVTVSGQVWRQVSSLRDSRPTDPDYEVGITEDSHLAFTFGDGVRGRRLPTGANNVRVSFRVGAGIGGNVLPGSLTKPARPDPRVAAVRQPLGATGGNDREDAASLKAQAPKSVLTLERVVSLADLGALAARQASVWQARAFALPTSLCSQASVEVVVVPAGGGLLGSLGPDLAGFLTNHALPGTDVRVTAFEPQPFDLEVEIEVKTAEFDAEEVRKRVQAALLDTFGLRRRALGASLFASALYAVIENTPGVESSRVTMGLRANGSGRVLHATDRQVIYLDPALSCFSVAVREFHL